MMTALGPSLSDSKRLGDFPLDVRSLSTDFGETVRSPSSACASPIEHAGSRRINKVC